MTTVASLFDLDLLIALLTHSCVILLFRGGKFGRGEGTSIKSDAEDEKGEEKRESEEEEDQEEIVEPYRERVIFFFWRGEIKLGLEESAERPDLEEPARNNELPFLANVSRDNLGVASFASSCTLTSTTFTKSRGSGCHSRENAESVTQDDE